MTRIYDDSLEQEYKTNVEMLEEIKDKAYQAGRAYERKRIFDVIYKVVDDEDIYSVLKKIEDLLKEPQGEY